LTGSVKEIKVGRETKLEFTGSKKGMNPKMKAVVDHLMNTE